MDGVKLMSLALEQTGMSRPIDIGSLGQPFAKDAMIEDADQSANRIIFFDLRGDTAIEQVSIIMTDHGIDRLAEAIAAWKRRKPQCANH